MVCKIISVYLCLLPFQYHFYCISNATVKWSWKNSASGQSLNCRRYEKLQYKQKNCFENHKHWYSLKISSSRNETISHRETYKIYLIRWGKGYKHLWMQELATPAVDFCDFCFWPNGFWSCMIFTSKICLIKIYWILCM